MRSFIEPNGNQLFASLLAAKHALQYTGLPSVGLKGTWHSLPHSTHTAGNISFGETVRFYRAPEAGEEVLDADGKEDRVYTYNAKAHPHLSEGSRLLVSYNTNVWNGNNTPYCYHPRFIWLDLDTV